MNIKIILLNFTSFLFIVTFGQQPKYSFKSFVSDYDTIKFKPIYSNKDGFIRTYIIAHPQIWDTDDDNKTYIIASKTALLCFEGQQKNTKKEGVFNVFLIDSLDNSKKYKIWEQTYINDQLNGKWYTYTLKGTLVSFQSFKNDSINGISRNYWIDGKTILEETEYFNGHNKYIFRPYNKNGNLEAEIPYENGSLTGIGKKYYLDGTLQEVAEFKQGDFNGTRKYFYPNGQLWIEQIYKDGKSWTVVANFTVNGQKRDAGTLKNGNGTIIFYNEDGSVRQIKNYTNGIEN